MKFKILFFLFFGFCCAMSPIVVLSSQGVESDSKEQEAFFVAKKAFDDGFYDTSLKLLESFLKNYPVTKKTEEAELLVGRCYFSQNRYLEALRVFTGITGDPGEQPLRDEAFYWIAEVYFRSNNFSKAIEYYEKIISGFPNSIYMAASIYSLGWCKFQMQDFLQAIKYFKIIEDKFPKEVFVKDAGFKILESFYNLKQYNLLKEKAVSFLKTYAQDSEKSAYIHFYLAEAEYYLGSYSEAADEYNAAYISSIDERIKALCGLGLVWARLKLKDYPGAEEVILSVKRDFLDKKNQNVLLMAKAVLLSEQKDFLKAKQVYEELAAEAVDREILIQANLGLADSYYNLGEYQEAISVYVKILDKSSGVMPGELEDRLHYGFAWALFKRGEIKKSIEEFRKTVNLSEDKVIKVAAFCQLADMQLDSGDFNQAIESYNLILKDYPDSPRADYAQYQLGIAYIKSSDYDSAVKAFKSLKQKFPDSKLLSDASYSLSLAYFYKHNYALSVQMFERFIAEYPHSILVKDAMYFRAVNKYNLGKFKESIEGLELIIRNYSLDYELVQKCEYEVADCYYQLGDEKEAMSRFKALREKYPDSKLTPEIIWWLGDYYYRHNEFNEARRYLISLVNSFPDNNFVPDAYYALGVISAGEFLDEEAVNYFKKVIVLGKSDIVSNAGIFIADIYAKQEKFQAALDIYENLLKDYENLSYLLYPKIAEIYSKMRQFEKAKYAYGKSLEFVPSSQAGEVKFSIAEVMEEQGKIKEAIDEYLNISNLYLQDKALVVKSLLRAASIYEDIKDFAQAITIYKRIISLNVEEQKYAYERMAWIRAHVK